MMIKADPPWKLKLLVFKRSKDDETGTRYRMTIPTQVMKKFTKGKMIVELDFEEGVAEITELINNDPTQK